MQEDVITHMELYKFPTKFKNVPVIYLFNMNAMVWKKLDAPTKISLSVRIVQLSSANLQYEM